MTTIEIVLPANVISPNVDLYREAKRLRYLADQIRATPESIELPDIDTFADEVGRLWRCLEERTAS